MREVIPNFYYLSAAAYAKKTGMGYATTLSKCKSGELDAYQTDGGQWKVKVCSGDAPDKNIYELTVKQNAEMRAIIETTIKLLSAFVT